MTEIRELKEVVEICHSLKKEVSCDFVGLAIQNETGLDVQWHYAIGNLNDKYQRITVRFGKGIAGKIISSGSPMAMTHFPHDITGKMTDYPIALAEKLVACFAVPLFSKNLPKGVLLIGNRQEGVFPEQKQEAVKDAAEAIQQVLKRYLKTWSQEA